MNSGMFLQGRPCVGSWLTYGLGSENRNLPGFVVLHGAMPRGGTNPLRDAKKFISDY